MHAIEMPLIDIVRMDLDGPEPTVTVEPFVSMGQLSHALLPLGFTLPVVPEMDDLTVGGLVNGTGIESSSHRHGLFHEICVAYELCLGDGTVLVASETEHADLFHAIPWSYGSSTRRSTTAPRRSRTSARCRARARPRPSSSTTSASE